MSGRAKSQPQHEELGVSMEWPATGAELRAAGYRSRGRAQCRSCGAEIIWAITPYGRLMPMERVPDVDDGVQRFRSHFATCVDAAAHRVASAKRVNRRRPGRGR